MRGHSRTDSGIEIELIKDPKKPKTIREKLRVMKRWCCCAAIGVFVIVLGVGLAGVLMKKGGQERVNDKNYEANSGFFSVFVGFKDGTVKQFDTKGTELMTLKHSDEAIISLFVDKTELTLYSGDEKGLIRKWNFSSSELIKEYHLKEVKEKDFY